MKSDESGDFKKNYEAKKRRKGLEGLRNIEKAGVGLPLEGSEKTPYSGKPMVLRYFFYPCGTEVNEKVHFLEKRSVAGSFHLESFLGPTELCQSII